MFLTTFLHVPVRYELISRCWSQEPGCRPSFTEIVEELNKKLKSMTTEEYIDVQAPSLSDSTPLTLSESGPNHGLSSVRISFANVFIGEENDAEDEDEIQMNEYDDPDNRSEEKSSDNVFVESEVNSDKAEPNMKVAGEDSVSIGNGSERGDNFEA
ncbi:Hypothetical predicted protein [Paramuricea clavata]|uniref:Uncharacterized protein n=1 Tax=Paramuricea clavata TaxID=317549 RepID=A0A6S7K6W5_PARCT|nr:Hypothetical predicted protein [Paramuricea clavata]